jgi:hypothetical protein
VGFGDAALLAMMWSAIASGLDGTWKFVFARVPTNALATKKNSQIETKPSTAKQQ